MGQFAPVAPIQILEKMREEEVLGSYHLLLTHHILEYPARFTELFQDLPFTCTIFVDNSVVELGDAASDEKVLEACKIIDEARSHGGLKHWIYPVLTDVMADGPATRKASTESYSWWFKNDHDRRFPLMVVLQGDSWEEFTKTADYFLLQDQFERIEYVGIPRILVDHLDTRWNTIKYVEAIRPSINIHLLGFSNDVTDDVICCNHPGVEGIDSAVPIRYSFSVPGGLYTPTSTIPPRPKDWFEKGEWDKVSYTNLHHMKKWLA